MNTFKPENTNETVFLELKGTPGHPVNEFFKEGVSPVEGQEVKLICSHSSEGLVTISLAPVNG